MTWFERLVGCAEDSPDRVREQLVVDGQWLRSRHNGKAWLYGALETPSLGQLRERVGAIDRFAGPTSVREVVANVQHLHRDPANANALFQVASQFNLLEMPSPQVTPESGVAGYENDHTQGPACAIAAGCGTIYRNYFANVNGRTGQSHDNQIDCLAGVGALLGNSGQRLWKMVNGYVLPSAGGLQEIDRRLATLNPSAIDELRQALCIGLQWDTQITLDDASHTVSQAYCSALPVAYARHASDRWAAFATLVLEAAYEATLCAGILNLARTGSRQVFLTLLGGGVFGNGPDWILGAMRRALGLYCDCGLDVAIVSYGGSSSAVQELLHDHG